MNSKYTDFIVEIVKYFHNSNIVNDYSMRRDGAIKAIKSYNNEKKKSVKLFWVLITFKNYNLIKPPKDRNVIVFNQQKYDEILSNAGAKLNKFKSTIVFNQYKSLEIQNKTTKVKKATNLKCFSCTKNFKNDNEFHQHMNSKLHKEINNLIKSKNSNHTIKLEVILSGNPTQKVEITVRRDKPLDIKFRLINTSTNDSKILKLQFIEEIMQISSNVVFPLILKANQQIDIQAELALPNDVDCAPECIAFAYSYTDGEPLISYKILYFTVIDENFEEYLPVTPYQRKKKHLVKERDREIVSGIPISVSYTTSAPRIRLTKYEIPKNLNIIFNNGFKVFDGISIAVENELKAVRNLLNVDVHKKCLTLKNYKDLLPLLLYLEEHQMNLDIREFDMNTKALCALKRSNYYKLAVPGLAEKRPSIIRGDSVYVVDENDTGKMYEGIVDTIQESEIEMGFHKSFQKVFVPNKSFYVIFSFCRLPLKVQHQAVRVVEEDVMLRIFPQPKQIIEHFKAKPLNLFNKAINNNPEQLQAVQCICGNTSGIYPYLVFGPPGTGKTCTLVEAIKQLHYSDKSARILVCATSNDAVNAITQRLIDVAPIPTMDLLRYLSFSCTHKNLSESMLKYTNIKNNEFYQPTVEQLCKKRVITSTLVNVARIYNVGLKNHFDYVFIDEAGHATETESLIPISCLLKVKGHIVLAGDHKQLGPIIHSPIAREYGFDISMLERLMQFDLYKNENGVYNLNYVTKLLNNYRSHETILKIPSELFYEGQLKAKGDPNLVNLAIGGSYDVLKNKNFPIIFHNVVGKDMRESVSPSFFNVNELQVVQKYVETLFDKRLSGRKITGSDIGIITPYRRQVQKLDSMCKKYGYKGVTVGSVEQFQGQERLIIIISTVRSHSNYLEFDYKFHLGFLSDKKRFNVAMTRAKALLIVVGNGNLLQLDPRFYAFIKYCHDNNAIYGSSFIIGDEPEEHLQTNLLNIFEDDITKNHNDNVKFATMNI